MSKFTLIIVSLLFYCLQISAQWEGAGWYRAHNTNNSSNKNYDSYISVVGDQGNFDLGNTDQRWFYGCIKMRKPGEEITDPGTVIYVNGLSNTTLSSQGVNTYQITQQYLSIKQKGTVDGKPVYSPCKSYLIYTLYLQVQNDYLLDPGQQDTYAKYWMEPLTEANRDTYYFGVKPLSKIQDNNGDYWTTLYAGFEFKIPQEGGVEGAYTIEEIDSKGGNTYVTPVKKWGRGQTVPRATPVLLQCKSLDPAVNVLIPTGTPTSSKYSGKNLLKGCYFNHVVSHATYGTYNIVTPNADNFRVLNVNSAGKIGFYKYSGTNMSANKAYLDLPANKNASRLYINFDGIIDQSEEELMVSEDGGFPDSIEAIQNGESHSIIYDLQGRRVSSENLTKGLYIVNGKKIFIQ